MPEVPGSATFLASADAYDRHIGRYGAPLANALCDAAGVRPGWRALDVGCGPGALTAVLDERLGREQVVAVDPSAPFAEACGRRLPGLRVEVAAAESLPFADATFDAALSQLVLNFMSDPPAGVRELSRVTRPGGVVAAAVWDYAGEMTLLRCLWDAAIALDPAASEHDEGRTMPYCSAPELEALFNQAGLERVTARAAVVEAAYTHLGDLWAPLETGVGPSGAYVAALPMERRAALRDELGRRLGAGSEPFRLTARAWIVTGYTAAPPR